STIWASPAPSRGLRIWMVEIRIVKRRGGWPTEFFPLELDISVTGTRAKTLVEQLWLWRKLRITACREPGRTDSRVILPEKEPPQSNGLP
ncbi:MAG: hypothetical protein P8Y95_03560, partial [Gammaproteobacteria bacterium]